MTIELKHGTWEVRQGHVMDVLRALPSESVHCVVTSPPYWGLRSYSTEGQVWGGDPECVHEWASVHPPGHRAGDTNPGPLQTNGNKGRERLTSNLCALCGAWRGELGLEPSVGLYVEHLLGIFREVRRVLRKDGTCFLNIGDSYIGSWGNYGSRDGKQRLSSTEHFDRAAWNERQGERVPTSYPQPGLKPKDLCLIPERLAIALQEDGWWVRSRIAWCKRAPMPESVQDRPTSAWEHIFLLTRSEHYYYDQEAVRVPTEAVGLTWDERKTLGEGPRKGYSQNGFGHLMPASGGRNLWNYWLLSPEAFPESHFATFPTEIPRLAISAGTSEHGVCGECGAPWKRVVEREYVGDTSKVRGNNRQGTERNHNHFLALPPPGAGSNPGITTGWQPTCNHPDAPIVPALVLDPFSGAGTSVMVALRLGRRGLGIELQPDYVAMSERRIVADQPLFNRMAEEEEATA